MQGDKQKHPKAHQHVNLKLRPIIGIKGEVDNADLFNLFYYYYLQMLIIQMNSLA